MQDDKLNRALRLIGEMLHGLNLSAGETKTVRENIYARINTQIEEYFAVLMDPVAIVRDGTSAVAHHPAPVTAPLGECSRRYSEEPIFNVCGRDMLAIPTVEFWIEQARIHGVNPDKIARAQERLKAMRRFATQYNTLVKLPD
jgi:hypothetical protein